MPLSSLPTELLDFIASDLNLSTFRSLRLTARHYQIRTLFTFKHRFFTTQHVAWTETSLQRLAYISANPSLGNALSYLIIDATPHYAMSMWQLGKRASAAEANGPYTEDEDEDEDASEVAARLNEACKTVQQEANAAARWFNETRFDVMCLQRVFRRVKRLESVVFAYEGMDFKYYLYADRYCKGSQHEMSRPFVSTMSALAATGTTVREIRVTEGRSHGVVSIPRLETLAPSLSQFDAVFEMLEVLQLHLRDWREPHSGFELERRRIPFSIRFLAKCSNVRTLELSCHSCFESDLFGDLARECRFAKLEHVTIELFCIRRAEDLVDLLTPSKGCLRELRLEHVLLDDPGNCWKEALGKFSDRNMGFKRIRDFHAHGLFLPGCRLLRFSGETHMTSLLHVQGKHWRKKLRKRMHSQKVSVAWRAWKDGPVAFLFL